MSINKSRQLVLLIATMLFVTASDAQSVYFNYSDGTDATYNLQDVRKITFSADVMNLHLLDGSVYQWNVSTIDNFQYNDTTFNIQEWLNQANTWQVKVFPNPTSTTLNVSFQLPKADQVSVTLTDMQGKLLFTQEAKTKTAGEHLEILDISGLPKGSYLCSISGRQTTITKQVVKQ